MKKLLRHLVHNKPSIRLAVIINAFIVIIIIQDYYIEAGYPGSSASKESAYNVGDLGSIPGLGRTPGGGHGNPLQYSCLENPHGQRSLAACSSWGHKESDTTKWLSMHNT